MKTPKNVFSANWLHCDDDHEDRLHGKALSNSYLHINWRLDSIWFTFFHRCFLHAWLWHKEAVLRINNHGPYKTYNGAQRHRCTSKSVTGQLADKPTRWQPSRRHSQLTNKPTRRNWYMDVSAHGRVFSALGRCGLMLVVLAKA